MKVTSRFVFFFMEVLLLGAQRKAVPDVPAYAERDLELEERRCLDVHARVLRVSNFSA